MPLRSLNSSVLKWPDRLSVEQALRSWVGAEARRHPGLLRLGYFGSYARGDWGVGSDLDVIAVVQGTAAPFEKRGRDWDFCRLPVPVDLLVYTQEEWRSLQEGDEYFVRRLNREAVWIYPEKPGAEGGRGAGE
jgi:uncharacterized protein